LSRRRGAWWAKPRLIAFALASQLDPMNPWHTLGPDAPFVLAEDHEAVTRFNATAVDATRLELGLLPEPFVGNLDAPVMLLALNPGVSDGDFELHTNEAFRRRVLACHRQESNDWPYYYLDPAVTGPGARWSARVLGPLVREVGVEAVAHGVVLFEYLPYHSRRFAHHRLSLLSQAFSFACVRASLSKAAAVFVTRGVEPWTMAVPELLRHPRLFRTSSTQNITISPRNCPDGWASAVAGIRSAG
jgi:hypothetical protein